MATAAMFAAGVAACGSSSKTGASSDTTTSVAAATTPTTASTTPTSALTPIDCSGTSAYVTDIGTATDFKPVTPDTLTIVTSLPGPGFFVGSESDPTKITGGYEYDMAKAMQQAFGLSKLVIRNENFDAIVAGTVAKYDVALSQISITCDRAKVVKFSIPYFQSNQGVLTNSDGPSVTTLAEAKKVQWGVQVSTTAADLLAKIKPDKQVKVFPQLSDVYAALQAKQIDAVLIDTAINLGEAAQSNGKFKVVSQFAQTGGPDEYGAILPKDSSNTGAVNAVLKNLEDTGKLAQLAKTDLTADPGTLPLITVP